MMRVFSRLVLLGWAVAFSVVTYAQTRYDKIEVGTTLSGGIGLGLFTKPLPLPPGEWVVVNKSGGSVGVSGGITEGFNSTPVISITARNAVAESPLVAFVVSFLPDTMPLSYSNAPCELKTSLFVDALDTRAGDVLYVCARGSQGGKFQSFLTNAPNSKDKWVKDNFSSLAPYAANMPDNIVGLELYGTRDIGRQLHYFFIARMEGDFHKDPAYASVIKEWTHLAGLEIRKFLDNSAATIPVLAKYQAPKVN